MYFHPATGQLAYFPKGAFRRYTPDFLIRHRETSRAFLVEIKPRAFEGQPQLDMHQIVANNYIHALKFDWTYKVVYDDQIILTADQLIAFEDCAQQPDNAGRFRWYQDYHRRITGTPLLTPHPSNRELDFIMRGWQQPAQQTLF